MSALLKVIGLSGLLLLAFQVGISLGDKDSRPPSRSLSGEELIAPTRSLEGREEEPARLVVVSEPPELEVLLDGTKIGKTPVWLKEVKAGMHALRVGDSEETDILLQSGKRLDLAYFKGSFIEIPEKKVVAEAPVTEPEKPRPPRKAVPAPDRELEEAVRRFEDFVSGAHDFF